MQLKQAKQSQSDEEVSESELQARAEQDQLQRLKRDVMRLGEEKLYARYTNLREKQREEEAIMERMIEKDTTTVVSSRLITTKGLRKVRLFVGS